MMKMKVLALCSQKGGVGKTTLCGHLGVEAEIKGHGPVALIDTDPQGSLASWWNEREAPEPVFAQVQIANLAEHLRLLDEAAVLERPRDGLFGGGERLPADLHGADQRVGDRTGFRDAGLQRQVRVLENLYADGITGAEKVVLLSRGKGRDKTGGQEEKAGQHADEE